jgi:hypothetical protein
LIEVAFQIILFLQENLPQSIHNEHFEANFGVRREHILMLIV